MILCALLPLCTLPFVFCQVAYPAARVVSTPFCVGEKLTYEASWAGLPAGEAVIEVLRPIPWGQSKAMHFAMDVRTNARVDRLYRIRDRQDSYTDPAVGRSLAYTKKNTGKHPRDMRIEFDWNAMTATYVNAGKRKKPIAIQPGTVDPLALIFAIRTRELSVGQILEIPITDGKKCIVAKARVSGREQLFLNGKTIDTYVVLPDTERLLDAAERRSRADLKIWFSVDEKRLPVQIQSRLPVGSFFFKLTATQLTRK